MIESVAGVEKLDEICSIPGVHAVFVGPNDLTVNMGIANQYDQPGCTAAFACSANVFSITHKFSIVQLRAWDDSADSVILAQTEDFPTPQSVA
jgi:2-keto-3-deoxy-L-rhamnonate aldolase RhmA